MNTTNANHTCNSQQKHARRRNGRIAKLPLNLRDAVNSMLDDGIPYDAIIAKLREHGFTIRRCNLTRWHNGGFQDYLKERLWLKEMQSNLDFILEHLRDNEGVAKFRKPPFNSLLSASLNFSGTSAPPQRMVDLRQIQPNSSAPPTLPAVSAAPLSILNP